MTHWAAPLIGARYEAGASGPDAFDCIGLVRYYFKTRHGLDLPDYEIAGGDVRTLLAFTRATGWRRIPGQAESEDLLLMENFQGRHIGIVLRTSEGLGLLHAQGTNKNGSVVWQPLDSLFGYRNKELWRSACIN